MEPECILEHMKVEAISAVAGMLKWVSVVQSQLVNLQTPCASSFLSMWHKPRYTWEEETSIEEFCPTDCPVVKSVEHFLD